MKYTELGRSGLKVSRMALGCMSMSEFYGKFTEKDAICTLEKAIDHGITMFDTADCYAHGANERLLGKIIRKHDRNKFVICTKFGIVREEGKYERRIDGSPEYVKKSCEKSLLNLGLDEIDLYYIHRVDSGIPIEETIGAMSELIKEGKIRAIGISECNAKTLRRAHAVHPVAALQTEYSMATRDPETTMLPLCKELGISFVAYSPISRGLLSPKISEGVQFPDDDLRGKLPRFSPQNNKENLRVLNILREKSHAKGCTLPQLALAWIMAQPYDIIPLTGARKATHLLENIKSVELNLSQEELQELNTVLKSHPFSGDRYTPEGMKGIDE